MVLESGLQKRFDEAADAVSAGACKDADVATTLRLYGLYCRVRRGAARAENKPSSALLDPRGAAKFDAWLAVSALSEEEAAAQYISAVDILCYASVSRGGVKKEASKSSHQDQFGKAAPQGFTIEPNHSDELKRDANGASTNATLTDGDVAREVFFESAEENDTVGVLAAVEAAGPQILLELDGDGLTGLMRAADRGHLDVVRALLELKAPTEIRDPEGQTALHYAAQCGHADVVAALIMAGASWKDALDSDGHSPAALAIEQADVLRAANLALQGAYTFPSEATTPASSKTVQTSESEDEAENVLLGLRPSKAPQRRRAISVRVVAYSLVALAVGSALVATLWRQRGFTLNAHAAPK